MVDIYAGIYPGLYGMSTLLNDPGQNKIKIVSAYIYSSGYAKNNFDNLTV